MAHAVALILQPLLQPPEQGFGRVWSSQPTGSELRPEVQRRGQGHTASRPETRRGLEGGAGLVSTQPQSSQWLGLTPWLPGHLAGPHTREDRLSPRRPALLAAFPEQAPCSEGSGAGGSSHRRSVGTRAESPAFPQLHVSKNSSI